MATGLNRLGASAYTTTPPPIVQEAKKDWQYYESKIAASEECTGRLYREYKEGGSWKEKYKTWAAACEVLGKSRSQVNKVIQQDKALDNDSSCATAREHAESVSLKKVEQAREPKEEEPEKPAVHSADEKPTTNGHAAKSPKPPMDISGCVIPQRLLLILERREEVKEARKWASNLKCLFERLQGESDPLFAHIRHAGSIQTFMTGAATMSHQLAECSPDVVCPECSGKSESCHYCDGSGWICEVRWNRDWVKSNDRLKGAEVARRAKNL